MDVIILLEQLGHMPTTEEIVNLLDWVKIKPEKILTDNANIFAEGWKNGASTIV